MARAKKASLSVEGTVRATTRPLASLLGLVVWIAGVLVSLAVGFGMVDGVLSVWYVSSVVIKIAGWIVVILAVLGVILKIIDKVGK